MSQQINLFNPVFLKQQKQFSLLAMTQGLALIVLGSLLFYGYASYQVAELGKQSIESSKRFTAEQARLARYSTEFSPQQSNQLLKEELQQLEKKAAESSRVADTLRSGAVGNTTGYSEYLRAFARQGVSGLWLTGLTITGDAAQISLTGGTTRAELVPVYIKKLGNEAVMQGKTFANLQMQAPKAEGKEAVKPANYLEFVLHSNPDGAPDSAKHDENTQTDPMRQLVNMVKAGKQ